MTTPQSIEASRDHLDRTLAFFPRVDTKASVVLAVDTSMLALLTTKTFPIVIWHWSYIPTGLAILCLGISLWYVYKEGFPTLEGGEGSLLYFREVAKTTEV